MSHSPGPWRLGRDEDGDLSVLAADGEAVIEAVSAWDIRVNGDGNAALIAKAPELLAMLVDLEWISPDGILACPVCQAIAYGFPKRGDKVHAPDCRLDALLRGLR